jgi:hypothetical protein
MLRVNRSVLSSNGVLISLNPNALKTALASDSTRCHIAASSGRISLKPFIKVIYKQVSP